MSAPGGSHKRHQVRPRPGELYGGSGGHGLVVLVDLPAECPQWSVVVRAMWSLLDFIASAVAPHGRNYSGVVLNSHSLRGAATQTSHSAAHGHRRGSGGQVQN